MFPITYSDAKNPRWDNAAKTIIVLDVNFNHLNNEEYSSCSVMDLSNTPGEEHITELWNRAKAGDFGEIPDFVVPDAWDKDETMLRMQVREKRNALLAESDIMITNDRWEDYTDEQKKAWKDYRKALRDVPTNWTLTASYDTEVDNFVVDEFTWPVKPDAS